MNHEIGAMLTASEGRYPTRAVPAEALAGVVLGMAGHQGALGSVLCGLAGDAERFKRTWVLDGAGVHVRHIMDKLNLRSRVEAAVFAFEYRSSPDGLKAAAGAGEAHKS